MLVGLSVVFPLSPSSSLPILTSDANKAVFSTQLSLAGHFLFVGPFFCKPLRWLKFPVDQQLEKNSDHVWHHPWCHVQSPINPLSSLFQWSVWSPESRLQSALNALTGYRVIADEQFVRCITLRSHHITLGSGLVSGYHTDPVCCAILHSLSPLPCAQGDSGAAVCPGCLREKTELHPGPACSFIFIILLLFYYYFHDYFHCRLSIKASKRWMNTWSTYSRRKCGISFRFQMI